MTWRCYIDETNYTNAELLAWHRVLPHDCLPILDSDYSAAKAEAAWLVKTFPESVLSAAVSKLGLREAAMERHVKRRQEIKNDPARLHR